MSVGFKICLVTDRRLLGGASLETAIEKALAGGVDAVQLREKDLGGLELYELAQHIRAMTARHGALFLVNDRIDVALASGADGVQLPASSFPPETARRLLPADRIVGASVHDLGQAERAIRRGADFVVFGPVFDTPSKRRYGPPQGVERLRELARALGPKVVAVGGITPVNARRVLDAGAVAVACISTILGERDPESAARQLKAALC